MTIDELNAEIAAATQGYSFPRGETIVVDRPVRVWEKAPGFQLFLNGATIKRETRMVTKSAALIHGRNCPALQVFGGHLKGGFPADQKYQRVKEDHHGVQLMGCDAGPQIFDLTIEDVGGDFIYLGATGGGGPQHPERPCAAVRIDQVRANNAGRHAIGAVAVLGLAVGVRVPCEFRNYRRRPIDKERQGPTKTVGVVPKFPKADDRNVWVPYQRS